MLFTTDGKAFLFAIDAARRAVSNRQYVECLRGVRLEASHSGGVVVAGTDLDEWCSCPVAGADVAAAGAVVVAGARDVAALVKGFGPGPLTVATVDGSLEIRSASGSARVELLPIEDYPLEPDMGETVGEVIIGRPEYQRLMSAVVRFASKDESRPVLTAVALETEPGRLTAVATDSYRLGFDWVDADTCGATFPQALIRAHALGIIAKYVKHADMVLVTVGANRARIECGPLTLTTRLVQGQYPDHKRLIPDAFEGSLTFAGKPAADAAARAAKIGLKNSPVRLGISGDTFTVEMVGEAGATVVSSSVPLYDSTSYTRDGVDPLTIGCNPSFVADAIAAVDSERVTVDYINPLRPIIFRNGKANSGVLQMPVRLAG